MKKPSWKDLGPSQRRIRDEFIFKLRTQELLSLRAIADRFGLSRERIRQIVAEQRGRHEDIQDLRAARNG